MFWKKEKENVSKENKIKKNPVHSRKDSAQKTIPFLCIYDDGIVEISRGKFSKTIEFPDVNYHMANEESQEGIFVKYCELLNYFNSSAHLQITINNKSINKSEFEKKILMHNHNDGLDKYRSEMNQFLKDQVKAGRNDIEKEKYLTLTINANKIEDARNIFNRMENEIMGLLRNLGSYGKIMPISKRMEILHDIYRPDNIGNFKFDMSMIKGNKIKDEICPDSFYFKKDYVEIGNRYGRAIFIRSLPSFINDYFFTDITDFSFNMVTSINVNPLEPEIALRMIKKQIIGMESNKIEYQRKSVKGGYTEAFVPFELRNNLEEAEQLIEDVTNKNQRLYLVNFIILIMDDSLEKLNEHTETVKSTAQKYVCQVGVLNYQQEDGINSAIPLGLNNISIDRCLTTEATAVFMPFAAEELMHPNGIFYGINAGSRNMILLNRKILKNQNGFILGTPGSGKSFGAKEEMLSVLLSCADDDIIIIDPEGEYKYLVRNFGGEVCTVAPNGDTRINLMDMNMNYDESDPLALKSDFLLSLCNLAIGGKIGLTAQAKSVLDRCISKAYANLINCNYDKQYTPLFRDLYNTIRNQSGEVALNLADGLELFAVGSLSTLFSEHTNINLKSRLLCFDLKSLGKQLKPIGMLIILDLIWNRITENQAKKRYTWLYVDEIASLFDNEYSTNYFTEVYSRARKYGGIITGITQNVERLLDSDVAKYMLSNSNFVLMFNQSPLDRVKLERLYNISSQQSEYITNSQEGHGLLYTGNNTIPFVNKFSKDTELYRLMTTKPGESNIA